MGPRQDLAYRLCVRRTLTLVSLARDFKMSNTSLVSVNQTALLTNLLPSTTYTLAYTLPLLLSSLCLTFAGAFLTLDRSRSFPPSYDSIPGDFFPRKTTGKFHWLLEGGIGGLAVGYVLGGGYSLVTVNILGIHHQVQSTCRPYYP